MTSNLKDNWKVAASTVGLMSIGTFAATQSEPVLAVCSFAVAGAAAMYIGLELSTSGPNQNIKKVLSAKEGPESTLRM